MQFNWHNKSVLVVEDDPINFKYLQLILEKRTGINVIWAKDGQEAYEKIINHTGIDLVLLDLQLPELNGIDVLRLAKAVVPELPIIMQTANSWNNEEENCIECGADAFFAKPINMNNLFDKMDECMKEYSPIKNKKDQVVTVL
jgi:two-component system, cell cycle response regulator DivK